MIKWSDYTFIEIISRWDEFQWDRKKTGAGTNKKPKSHLTVEDRERLIDELLSRLENAKSCIEN